MGRKVQMTMSDDGIEVNTIDGMEVWLECEYYRDKQCRGFKWRCPRKETKADRICCLHCSRHKQCYKGSARGCAKADDAVRRVLEYEYIPPCKG